MGTCENVSSDICFHNKDISSFVNAFSAISSFSLSIYLHASSNSFGFLNVCFAFSQKCYRFILKVFSWYFQANNGSYQKITKTMEQGLYYHWVCVYNGSTLTAYVNGNKLGSIACNGPLTFQADSGKVVYLGSDTNATGDSEKPVDCSIAITRIYSEALTAEQANILWENVADGRDKDIYNDDAYDPNI